MSTIHITPKNPHGSNPRHPYGGTNAEGDTFEFVEFTQSQPLTDSDAGKDSHSRQNARSDTSTLGFQFRALIDWKWETASCFLAVGSLIAIMATVYPYDGHPLPQWPYGLSINSLISIYTTIMKAAMYSILAQGKWLGQLKWTWFGSPRRLDHLESFDDASRGALGAAKLLWVLRGRNPITIIGALVTIFAIAIDPFTQQLVHYYNCSQVVPSKVATIPKTNFYDDPGGRHVWAGEKSINTSMQAAVYAGIFSPGTNSVKATCSTGNCTFPELYKTIAYCSACTEITSQLNKTIYNYTKSTGNYTATNYTLPSGLHLSNSVDTSFIMGTSIGAAITIQAIMATPPISLTCSDDWPWGCTGIGAAECQISLCIKTFNASVQSGTLNETEVSNDQDTWYGRNQTIWGAMNSDYVSTVDMSCLNNTEKETLRTAGYQFSDETKWLPYNTSLPAGLSVAAANASGISLPANYTELDINGSCIYQSMADTVKSMNDYIFGAFKGNVTLGPGSDYEASSSSIYVIFNNGNVSAETFANAFQSVTDSMTTNMRNYPDAHTPNYVTGIVLQSDTCVDSRWNWLIFPTALVLLTLVFFAAVIVQTRTRDAMVSGSQDYKNSALPLLFHGLEESITARYGQGEYSMAKMSQDANKLSVVFKPTDVGWRFVADES